MPDGAALKLDTSEFARTIDRLQRANRREPGKVVRFWARKMLVKLALGTTIAPQTIRTKSGKTRRVRKRGRARAGWWAAAAALRVSNIYTGFPNSGEGSFVDGTRGGTLFPTFTLTNTVPYATRIVGILPSLAASVAQVNREAIGRLERQLGQVYAQAGR